MQGGTQGDCPIAGRNAGRLSNCRETARTQGGTQGDCPIAGRPPVRGEERRETIQLQGDRPNAGRPLERKKTARTQGDLSKKVNFLKKNFLFFFVKIFLMVGCFENIYIYVCKNQETCFLVMVGFS